MANQIDIDADDDFDDDDAEDLDEDPTDVGIATLAEDGTLEMQLRTVARNGTIGEALLLVATDDERYASMIAHIGGLEPGQSKPIPPFPSGG